ncbi:MAG: HAMP domain-containing histidine kinase [Dehalococcoidia bacterium]|nr:HAMP domain-containing histidine kinase [Dehalococcoidia bacterium]
MTPDTGSGPTRNHAPGLDQDLEQDLGRVLALWLVDEGSSADDIAARVQEMASRFDREAASAALAELADAGLVRTRARSGDEVDYVRTTLGHEYVGDGFASDSPVATRLAELEHLRTDLVATIAHELKTPLTAIRTCVGLLIDSAGRADEEVRERLLTRVATSAESMQHLIANLLDLAGYRAGSVQLEPRWVDATQVARDAAAYLAPQIEERRQEVRFTAPPALQVYADRRRLEQALGNLLSNALKFSPPDSVIEVTVRPDGDQVAWDIRDHGEGITEEDQSHLFERFFRGRGDREGGTGLGLPIALAAVQAHGGSITVDSEPGRGSTFTVTIPVARDPGGHDEDGGQS